jgi:16S rRNA G966 N2-methylase RsmD
MIITTSSRANRSLVEQAHQLAKEWGESFQSRGVDSILDIQNKFSEDVLVVGKNRIELFVPGEDQPIFFHPNLAMLRIKRLIKGAHDPFVEACKLSTGTRVLDCTLGLGSDSIVASFCVGSSGQVTSLEGNKTLANLVKTGLKTWESQIPEMDEAMRSIQVKHSSYQEFLLKSKSGSFDVIYFDPMFEQSIQQANGLVGVKKLAFYDDLLEQTIIEAKRVGTQRIILKDHWKSNRFDTLGFTPIRRKSANFHYGVIELE